MNFKKIKKLNKEVRLLIFQKEALNRRRKRSCYNGIKEENDFIKLQELDKEISKLVFKIRIMEALDEESR